MNPGVPLARSEAEILENPEIQLICSGAIFGERGDLTVRAMRHGKDVFIDKPPMTTVAQLEAVERAVRETGRLWFVLFGERLQDRSSIKALELINGGVIGRVVNFIGLGPHRLLRPTRPDWFFVPEKYGGIINDIGIHQVEFFTHLGGGQPKVVASRIGNFNNRDIPTFQDFGDATLTAPNGIAGYIRVDWLSPEGLGTWGDIRNIFVGTNGYIELRKTIDLAVDPKRFTGNQLFVTTRENAPQRITCNDVKVTLFEDVIRDIRERKNRAVPHEGSFAACRAALEAQARAERISD
jgi:predicted dehydrogenase